MHALLNPTLLRVSKLLITYFIESIFAHQCRLLDPVDIERTDLEQEILIGFAIRRCGGCGSSHLGIGGVCGIGGACLWSRYERHALLEKFLWLYQLLSIYKNRKLRRAQFLVLCCVELLKKDWKREFKRVPL